MGKLAKFVRVRVAVATYMRSCELALPLQLAK